jgi:hypothetical protein
MSKKIIRTKDEAAAAQAGLEREQHAVDQHHSDEMAIARRTIAILQENVSKLAATNAELLARLEVATRRAQVTSAQLANLRDANLKDAIQGQAKAEAPVKANSAARKSGAKPGKTNGASAH